MAVTVANQTENHRAVYFEVTGDGATTSFTVTHNKFKGRANHTVQVKGVTAPTNRERKSDGGGLAFPSGTAVTVSSASLNPSTGVITVTTSPALGNGVVGYFVAIFDQHTD